MKIDDAALLECCGTTDRLTLKLRGGEVRRYHTEAIGVDQYVAQHSWRVQVILHHLWPEATPELLLTALYHDVAEIFTGDMPAPLKRWYRANGVAVQGDEAGRAFEAALGLPSPGELSEEDHLRLKVVDYLELILTVRAAPPSQRASQIITNGVRYISEMLPRFPEVERARVLVLLNSFLSGRVSN